MFVSYKWLKEYVDITVTPQELADKMSVTGIEIEGVTSLGEGLKKIVVGKTLDVIDHPDSDHLHICQVEVGEAHAENGVLQIVCGASNVAAGQKVIVALPGARIKDNIKIKKGKIRGQESHGMICSLEELGFSSSVVPKEYSDGIFVLPEDAPVGEDVLTYLSMDDAILELSITPNRADALNMYGVAFEVGALYEKTPHFKTFEAPIDNQDTIEQYVSVHIDNPEQTHAYNMTVIKDVTVAPSPLWLQTRLMTMGIRPINNVVDATNYMLLAYGQPLHAFDYQTLPSKNITTRQARKGEVLVTLDGEERVFTEQDNVITANDTPIALAGVMGGLETEITEKTTVVALETALFDATTVRQTAKRFNLRSESSLRFEKGINRGLVAYVAEQAAALIAQLSGGTVVKGSQMVQNITVEDVTVAVTLTKINRVLGTELTMDQVVGLLNRLGFTTSVQADTLSVVVPPRRFDIRIEADVIEEVARIYGYDQLPSTLPITPSTSGGLNPLQQFIRATRRVLESVGYTQIIGYSLTTDTKAGAFAKEENNGVRLSLPMSEERSVLRRSLVSGLLEIAHYNVARNNTRLALYETGRVFFEIEGVSQPREDEHIALLLTGNREERTWFGKAQAYDYYDIKGALDTYFEKIGVIDHVTYVAKEKDGMHPGRTAFVYVDDIYVGFVGQVHPQVAQTYDLQNVYVAELDATVLKNVARTQLVQKTIPKYPSMTRDIALLVDRTVTHQQIVQVLTQSGGEYLTNVMLFDHYAGEGIEPDKKSLAYRLTFLNVNATLVEEDVNAAMQRIVTALESKVNAVIR